MVLLVLFTGRLAISGQGYLEDSDEVDYFCAEDAFDALVAFRFSEFSHQISLTEGKPTETLFKVAQVPIHRLWALVIHEPRHSPSGLWILGFINILVSLSVLLVFYLILLALNIRKEAALLAMAALGVLVNFNLYTRHLLSYDLGLLFPLLSLLILIRSESKNEKELQKAGFISSLGFTSYHGLFMIYPIIGAWLFYSSSKSGIEFKKRIRFIAKGFFPLLVFYEIFFWIGGHSFFLELLKIGGSIGQGSFNEGIIYAPLYLSKVEGWLGIIIFILMLLATILGISQKATLPAQRLLLISVMAYLLFSFAVYFLHAFVFYGRIMHLYIPFFVLGAVLFLEHWNITRSKFIQTLLFLSLGFQYFENIKSLNSFTYPRKVLSLFPLSESHIKSNSNFFYYELDLSENYITNQRFIKQGTQFSNSIQEPLFFKNTCFFQHHPDRFIETYKPFDSKEKKIVFEKLHFMSYPAYTFEYCSSYGRTFYLEKQIKIAVYQE
jgi:hypothetical protein